MRAVFLLGVALLVMPVMAVAQSAAPASTPPPAAAEPEAPAAKSRTRSAPDISRDEYIQKAVERARRNAEKRFDKMDTDHNGILTADERRAARAARHAASAPAQ
jgi:hypothetical protein